MTDTFWWGYSKRHGWVLLDRSKRANRPGSATPLIFLRCRDGKEYTEDKKNWEPPYYVVAKRSLMSLPIAEAREKLKEFITFKKKYAANEGHGKTTPEAVANRFQSIRINGQMPLRVAQQLVEQSAYWHGHPSGRPVSAPSHHTRIYHGPRGWAIDFGANTFLIERAFNLCEKAMVDYLSTSNTDGFERRQAVELMRRAVRASVANHIGDLYESYWSENGFLVFGTQAIRIDDFINEILTDIGL